LAGDSPNAVVQGLNETPVNERPPLFVHYLFDSMVTIGIFLTVLSMLYLWMVRKFKNGKYPRWLLRLIVWSGPLAMLGIEFGWVYAEIGRQPWILRGYMKTHEGATTSTHVDSMLVLFCLLYIILGFTAIKVLSKLFKNSEVHEELIAVGIEREGSEPR
jgi:cytochrome d ubiquinol oxidase subunit I